MRFLFFSKKSSIGEIETDSDVNIIHIKSLDKIAKEIKKSDLLIIDSNYNSDAEEAIKLFQDKIKCVVLGESSSNLPKIDWPLDLKLAKSIVTGEPVTGFSFELNDSNKIMAEQTSKVLLDKNQFASTEQIMLDQVNLDKLKVNQKKEEQKSTLNTLTAEEEEILQSELEAAGNIHTIESLIPENQSPLEEFSPDGDILSFAINSTEEDKEINIESIQGSDEVMKNDEKSSSNSQDEEVPPTLNLEESASAFSQKEQFEGDQSESLEIERTSSRTVNTNDESKLDLDDDEYMFGVSSDLNESNDELPPNDNIGFTLEDDNELSLDNTVSAESEALVADSIEVEKDAVSEEVSAEPKIETVESGIALPEDDNELNLDSAVLMEDNTISAESEDLAADSIEVEKDAVSEEVSAEPKIETAKRGIELSEDDNELNLDSAVSMEDNTISAESEDLFDGSIEVEKKSDSEEVSAEPKIETADSAISLSAEDTSSEKADVELPEGDLFESMSEEEEERTRIDAELDELVKTSAQERIANLVTDEGDDHQSELASSENDSLVEDLANESVSDTNLKTVDLSADDINESGEISSAGFDPFVDEVESIQESSRSVEIDLSNDDIFTPSQESEHISDSNITKLKEKLEVDKQDDEIGDDDLDFTVSTQLSKIMGVLNNSDNKLVAPKEDASNSESNLVEKEFKIGEMDNTIEQTESNPNTDHVDIEVNKEEKSISKLVLDSPPVDAPKIDGLTEAIDNLFQKDENEQRGESTLTSTSMGIEFTISQQLEDLVGKNRTAIDIIKQETQSKERDDITVIVDSSKAVPTIENPALAEFPVYKEALAKKAALKSNDKNSGKWESSFITDLISSAKNAVSENLKGDLAGSGDISRERLRQELETIHQENISELLKIQVRLRNLKDERNMLLGEITGLREKNGSLDRENNSLKVDIDDLKIEIEVLNKKFKDEIDFINQQNFITDRKEDKLKEQLKLKEEELIDLKGKLAMDAGSVKQRELDLEGQLELIKMDSENLLQNREKKITELKRKIDCLQFNMDTMSDRERKLKESNLKLEEKLDKIMRLLKSSVNTIEYDIEAEDNLWKKTIKAG